MSVGRGVADGVGDAKGDKAGKVGGGIWISRGGGVLVEGVGEGSKEGTVADAEGDASAAAGDGVDV